MARPLWQFSFIIFPAIAILHLYVSPFTKVEESFNIQAIHDILEYGVPINDATEKFQIYFDHMTFPGAVPRTFIGSIIIAGLSKPEIWFGELAGKAAQIHVRAVLGGLNATALAFFARSIASAYGPITAAWYVVLQASQFHLWYYASRTLPNMFAFFLSTISLALLLPAPTSKLGPVKRTRLGLYLMTIATVIFRSELALLLGAHCLWLLVKPQTLNAKLALIKTAFVPSILPGALLALLVTVLTDTYFWRSPTPLWPELSAFLSNVFPTDGSEGASAWGTQPFYWYLTAALPRLLMNQILMVDLFFYFPSTLQDVRVLDNLIPSYAYLLIYSILPHKETRFMFPIVPSLTLVAALTCTRLTINANKSAITKFLLVAAVVSTTLTAFVSHAILLPLSAQNYPGGQALEALHEYYNETWQDYTPLSAGKGQPEVHVHLTNLALQTGVTRFLEQPAIDGDSEEIMPPSMVQLTPEYVEEREPLTIHPGRGRPAITIHPKAPRPSSIPSTTIQHSRTPLWVYDKTSNETAFLDPTFWAKFDFVIVEDPALAIGAWEIVDEINSIGSPQLLKPGEECQFRFHGLGSTPDEFLAGLTQPDHQDISRGGSTALLHVMFPSFIAAPLAHLHNVAHDVVRCGRGLPRGLGYWVELPLKTRLYILQRSSTGVRPNRKNTKQNLSKQSKGSKKHEAQQEPKVDDRPGLPEHPTTDQQPMDFNKLGPLVVNKDGTLSRLENWAQMNEQERKKTVDYLKKRNMIRLETAAE